MSYAPIALFVYNRPLHLLETLSALEKNTLASQSDLIIFSDGPRTLEHIALVDSVRTLIADIRGFKTVRTIISDANQGLAKSVIQGVSKVLQEYNRVIVLEDDMKTSPYFLDYMNKALELYETDDQVISIHGYMYPVSGQLPNYFFLRGADCWGWSTWRRGWNLFREDSKDLLKEIKERGLSAEFDYNSTYPFTQMLWDQSIGKIDSWAIRWQASAFLLGKLTLYPRHSFVKNIGFDNTGIHSTDQDKVFDITLQATYLVPERIPITESTAARRELQMFFQGIKPTLIKRVIRRINKLLK